MSGISLGILHTVRHKGNLLKVRRGEMRSGV